MPPLRIRTRFWLPERGESVDEGVITIAGGRIARIEASGDADLDWRDRVALPGFIDSHLHLSLGSEMLAQLDLSGARSRKEFEDAIAKRHRELPQDRWLLAHGWSNENWPDRMMPNRSWLAAAGTRPVVCYRMDHHACVVNDAVLGTLDLRHDPPGGRIDRDAGGAPTGLLVEAAAWMLVNPIIPEPTIGEKRNAVRAGAALLHRQGVTSVGTMEYRRDVVDVIEPLRGPRGLRCMVTLLDRDWPLDVSLAQGIASDEWLRIIGFKAFIDGTLGSRTARMLDSYADDPGNRGLLVELADRGLLHAWARVVVEANLSPSMHAIGDEAARLALDAADSLPPTAPVRIEHAQTIHPDDLPRFRGRIASMQPLHKADDGRYAEARLGPGRMDRFFPFRSLLEAGALLAFGSDWPIVKPNVMAGIRTAVTGLTLDDHLVCPRQNLTPAEAIRAFTSDAARALGRDDLGRMVRGHPADLVFVDIDPLSADWVGGPPAVVGTMVGGDVVFEA